MKSAILIDAVKDFKMSIGCQNLYLLEGVLNFILISSGYN